jgi:hypothetical protein
MAKLKYLLSRGAYENQVSRGAFSFRSKRLDTVIAEIDAYIRRPSAGRLDLIEAALAAWETKDPKEFKSRGLPLKPDMAGEIQLARVQLTTMEKRVFIPVLDPNDHPKYEPDLWNQDPYQTSTNCYAYACDSLWGHYFGEKPQPGSYGAKKLAIGTRRRLVHEDKLQFGSAKPDRTAPAVRLAIMRDGQNQGISKRLIPIIRQPGERVSNIPGHYLVALVIASGHQVPKWSFEEYARDYHWYRQDKDGMWSHKPGHSEATNLDGSGNEIYDPRACDMEASFWDDDGVWVHIFYEFVMFFYCPRGGVKVGLT